MNTECHNWYSPSLGREMEIKVYGHYGRALLVFPAAGGTFHEFEDFGMIDVCRQFIDDGRIKVFTVGSVDNESWLNRNIHPVDRARRHEDYERYIINEVVPFVQNHCRNKDRFFLTGCSMGGYHTVNFMFRYPWAFGGTIALSGVYGPGYFIGDYMDDYVAQFFPPVYLPGLRDPHSFDLLRSSDIIISVGQGPWERSWDYDCVEDARTIAAILDSLRIPAWVDFWGNDVSHDWVWWKVQLPYFLGKIL